MTITINERAVMESGAIGEGTVIDELIMAEDVTVGGIPAREWPRK